MATRELRAAGVSGAVHVKGLVGAAAGGVSGGTLASFFGQMDARGGGGGGGVHSLVPGWQSADRQPQMHPAYCASARGWTLPSVMASINERVVARSASLAPTLYGLGFDYREATLAGGPVGAVLGSAALALGGLLLALKPTRWMLQSTLLPAPGQGPPAAARDAGHFNALFVASEVAPAAGAQPRRTLARVALRGADPGYKGTAMMAAEAALCLALQSADLPPAATGGGALTPAVAMGDTLVARLRARGFVIEVRSMLAEEVVKG
jgi:short subunit dehydrogenase-like uncharacterized protein